VFRSSRSALRHLRLLQVDPESGQVVVAGTFELLPAWWNPHEARRPRQILFPDEPRIAGGCGA